MIPFRIQLRPGVPISEQIIYAAKRAIVCGQLQPGDPFPSVRVLSREAHINPNTAAKIIAALLAEQLLESRPGVGTVVATLPGATQRARRDLLTHQIEPLIVEAKLLGLTREAVLEAVADHFQSLTQSAPPNPSSGERLR